MATSYADRMDEQRELDAIHKHNRRSWEAVLGAPLDELVNAMTADELRAAIDILRTAEERKRREAEQN